MIEVPLYVLIEAHTMVTAWQFREQGYLAHKKTPSLRTLQ